VTPFPHEIAPIAVQPPETYNPGTNKKRRRKTLIKIEQDTKGQPYIEWQQAKIPNGYKRAWILHQPPDKDWAGTGRYVAVVRIDKRRPGIGGNPTDFPIFNKALSDEQILEAFVSAVCAITGCSL
jgi:hypothetical protein